MTVPKIALVDVPARILFINASPRGRNNTGWLIDQAIKGAQSVGNVEVEVFNFKGKEMAPCEGCAPFCEKNKRCVHDDAFTELSALWLRAEGIVWGAPVYTFGPPAQARAFMDRLGEIVFQNNRNKGRPLLRYLKPTGVIIQGSHVFSGQEIAAQSFMEHIVQMDCIPVSGDTGHDQAVMGYVPDKETPEVDTELLHACYRLGARVAEMTKLIKLGKLAIAGGLPDVYWYSPAQYGEVERPARAGMNEVSHG